jgi:lysyl-tRNA synthetase class 2
MDKSHNPEFTMLRSTVTSLMMGMGEMMAYVAQSVNGSPRATVGETVIDFSPPWKRISMFDAIREHTRLDLQGKPEPELRAAAKQLHVEVPPTDGSGKIIDEIFSAKVEPHLIQPTFITDYPVEMSPLAKRHRSLPGLVERFEAICNGHEICNAFTELNDPLDQRARFEEQMRARARGEEEVQPLDEDFPRTEYGMPPTAGLGIGIDRITMLLTGQESIRDVMFFPQLKPER